MANHDRRFVTLTPPAVPQPQGTNAGLAPRRPVAKAANWCKKRKRTHADTMKSEKGDRRQSDPGGRRMCEICRRDFIRGAAALGTTGLFSSPLLAQTPRNDSASTRLPARGEFTITNAYIMTMERDFGDFAGGSVHVRDGEIVAVGHGVSGGETIDGSGMIVMPGLVETHWHMWNTIFRSFAGDKQEEGYFPTVARFGQQMTPDDIFQSTRLSAAEAINSGMTFVHSWCHNVRSTAHAEADIRALSQAGIRARHSCGWPQGLPDTQSADQAPIETLAKNWKSYSNEGLLTLGMGWRGQFRAGPIKPEVYQPEFDNARKLGLADHRACRGGRPSRGQPGRTALQVETDGQGRSTRPCAGGYAGRTRHDRGIRRCDFDVARI